MPTQKKQSKLKVGVDRRVAEKWRDWSASAFDLTPEEEQELEDLADAEVKLEREAALMAEMIRLPQWALMEEFRTNLIEVLRSALERLDPTSDVNKIRDIQAELRVLRKYENFVLSKISAI